MKVVQLTLALFGLIVATPLAANDVAELTFDQKVSQADLVVMATVDAVHGQPGSNGSSATLSVVRTLKGHAPNSIDAITYSDIAELNPQCCELGATYIMFLVRTPNGGLASVQGRYGMVRIGAPRTHLESRLSLR